MTVLQLYPSWQTRSRVKVFFCGSSLPPTPHFPMGCVGSVFIIIFQEVEVLFVFTDYTRVDQGPGFHRGGGGRVQVAACPVRPQREPRLVSLVLLGRF